MKDISNYPFICLDTGTVTRSFFDDLFQKNDTNLSVDIEPRTISIIYDTEYPQSLAAKEFLKFLTLNSHISISPN